VWDGIGWLVSWLVIEMSDIIPLDALLGGLALIAGGAFGGIFLGIGIARKMWRI
jgi:hypothetical protein